MSEKEIDSDDDFEGYFLKPVNEYNIVDKIKEANNELFSTPQPPSPSSTGLQRKVTFRAVLEDYEPQEQYAVEIEVASVTTEEGIISDVHQSVNLAVVEEEPKLLTEESVKPVEELESENEIEEICEEIVDFDLEPTREEIPGELKKNVPLEDDSENLISDKCEDSKKPTSPQNSMDSSSDDDLSLIVAAYIDDDPKNKFHEDDENTPAIKTKYKRSFSLRSRKKNKKKEVEEVPKIKLSYKTCCEYKNATHEPLPKYTGYLSTYGLSKDQWEKREKLLQKKQKHLVEKGIKASEEEIKKMDDNERAFISWLRNKMRCPINKTKNMFDFKPKKQKNK